MNPGYRLALVAAGLVLLFAGADLAWHYPRLPERVATHFNASGRADGWSSRSGLLTTSIVMFIGVGLLAAASQFLVRFAPARFINMPRRDFWLVPVREAFTRAQMATMLQWLFVVLLGTLTALNHLTLRANLAAEPDLGHGPWIILAGTVAVVLGVIGGYARSFARAA